MQIQNELWDIKFNIRMNNSIPYSGTIEYIPFRMRIVQVPSRVPISNRLRSVCPFYRLSKWNLADHRLIERLVQHFGHIGKLIRLAIHRHRQALPPLFSQRITITTATTQTAKYNIINKMYPNGGRSIRAMNSGEEITWRMKYLPIWLCLQSAMQFFYTFLWGNERIVRFLFPLLPIAWIRLVLNRLKSMNSGRKSRKKMKMKRQTTTIDSKNEENNMKRYQSVDCLFCRWMINIEYHKLNKLNTVDCCS